MNKYYADKEMIFPFKQINQMEFVKEDIEHMDYLQHLFQSTIVELNGRINGAYLLANMSIGDVLDSAYVEDEDYYIYNLIQEQKDVDELIIDENVLLIAKKRYDALNKLFDVVNDAYQRFLQDGGVL